MTFAESTMRHKQNSRRRRDSCLPRSRQLSICSAASCSLVALWLGMLACAHALCCDEVVERSMPAGVGMCSLTGTDGWLQVDSQGNLLKAEQGGGDPAGGTDQNDLYWAEYYEEGLDPSRTVPILAVSSGNHEHLLPLRYLACHAAPSGTRYRIIFYDQLGFGQSQSSRDGSRLQAPVDAGVGYYTQELQAVTQGVALKKNAGPFHMIGHGLGGLLALLYATSFPDVAQDKMASLILSSPLGPNTASLTAGIQGVMQGVLPPLAYNVLMHGDAEDEEFTGALGTFRSLTSCRLQPMPDCLIPQLDDPQPVWGPFEWQARGSAASLDMTKDLPGILVPTYAFVGQYDFLPRSVLSDLSSGVTHIPWIHTEVVPLAGHFSHIDNFAYVYSGLSRWLDDTASKPYFEAFRGESGGKDVELKHIAADHLQGGQGAASSRIDLDHLSPVLAVLAAAALVGGLMAYARRARRTSPYEIVL
jgi:pimeloyl-ACP methyl ester carboxylesterase